MIRNLTERIIGKLDRSLNEFYFKVGLDNHQLSNKKGGAILCYHGVDLTENKTYNLRFVSKNNLEKQFIFFKKHFNVISVSDFFEKKFNPNKFNIAITFDDGYKNNYKYALPLLEKHQLPASFYITGLNNTKYNFLWPDFLDIITIHDNKKEIEIDDIIFTKRNNAYLSENGKNLKHYIKEKGRWHCKEQLFNQFNNFNEIIKKLPIDDYWQLMSDEEIKLASKSKHLTIGSHGFLHNNLGNIPLEDSINEAKNSINYLENLTQKKIDEIAFPDGSYSREIISEFKKLNFNKQLALDYLFEEDNEDDNILNRHGIYPIYGTSYQIKSIPNLINTSKK